MNRLWIKLSIAVGIIIIFSNVFIGVAMLLIHQTAITEYILQLKELAIANDLPFPNNPITFVIRRYNGIMLGLLVASSAAVVFGIIVNWLLTTPLMRLADHVRQYGKSDLSNRVQVEGSREIREVAQAFNEVAANLEHTEQLRRSLVSDVAHELRTPLSVLQANTLAILDGVVPNDDDQIAKIYNQTRHLTRLVNDLHELSLAEAKAMTLNLREVDVTHLIQELHETFQASAKQKHIDLTVHIQHVLPTLTIDPDRIRQVLRNLLANALRHTPENGKITIHASRTSEEVLIEVEDTGEGIADDQLSHIFERFYRTDASRSRDMGGTGLGLAICKSLVELHNGAITARNSAQHGAIFQVTLPISSLA
ncbi:MAG: HAMP domain-containing protein [Anaerolineae bacterium]|nr:HAMP domain-containing protein [Anaerolineae bacterium]